jgi:hypothetical protein
LAGSCVEESRSGQSISFRFTRSAWLLPLSAGSLALAGVIAFYALLLGGLYGSKPGPAPGPQPIQAFLDRAREALAEGSFQSALRQLEEADSIRTQHAQVLSLGQDRDLSQLRRQASLLADLPSVQELSLLLGHAVAVRDLQEWQAVFDRHYKGMPVILDTQVHRSADGQYQVGYTVFARGKQARLELADLTLFKDLPLERPQRVLFGARLASVRLEAMGKWVIRFDPGSAVLVTDEGVAAACSSRPLEEELREVVRRQAAWLEQLP